MFIILTQKILQNSISHKKATKGAQKFLRRC